jgi:hypothetical protein
MQALPSGDPNPVPASVPKLGKQSWTPPDTPTQAEAPKVVKPEETYIHPNATKDDLVRAAKLWGLDPKLIAQSKNYNFDAALKDNQKPLGYDADLIDTGLSKVGVGQNFNQGMVEQMQSLGNKLATVWRNPADQEAAKFEQMLRQSNFTQRQMKGEDNSQYNGGYDAPLSRGAGKLTSGVLAAAPVAITAGAALPVVGAGAIALPVEGAIYGAIGSPEDMTGGAVAGAVTGGLFKAAGMGAKAAARGLNPNGAAAGDVIGTAKALGADRAVGMAEATGSAPISSIQAFAARTPFVKSLSGVGTAVPEKAAVAQTIPGNAVKALQGGADDWGSVLSKEVDVSKLPLQNPLAMSPIYSGLSADGKNAALAGMLETAAKSTTTNGVVDLGALASKVSDIHKTLGISGQALKGEQAWTLQGLEKLLQSTSKLEDLASTVKPSDTLNVIGVGILLREVGHALSNPIGAATDLIGAKIGDKVFSWLLNSPASRDALIRLSGAKTTAQIAEGVAGVAKAIEAPSASAAVSPVQSRLQQIKQNILDAEPGQGPAAPGAPVSEAAPTSVSPAVVEAEPMSAGAALLKQINERQAASKAAKAATSVVEEAKPDSSIVQMLKAKAAEAKGAKVSNIPEASKGPVVSADKIRELLPLIKDGGVETASLRVSPEALKGLTEEELQAVVDAASGGLKHFKTTQYGRALSMKDAHNISTSSAAAGDVGAYQASRSSPLGPGGKKAVLDRLTEAKLLAQDELKSRAKAPAPAEASGQSEVFMKDGQKYRKMPNGLVVKDQTNISWKK